MKRIFAYLVILLTIYSSSSSAGICENAKLISDYPNKTAFVGQKIIQEDIRANTINERVNSILPNLEFDTVKLEKGRRFVVISDRNLDSTNMSGIPVKFESIQKEYLAYDKEPAKIVFQGHVEKTRKPRLAGKSGTIKIKLEKITINKITYPVSALISKIDNQRVFFNTLAGTPVYIMNLSETINNGTINSDFKDPCYNHTCVTGSNFTKPFIFLGAAALQTADLLLSPLASLFKTGKNLTIPEKTYFEIKIDKDLYVLNI